MSSHPDRVLITLSSGVNEPEQVINAFQMGIAALRAGRDTAMWLTGSAVVLGIGGGPATALSGGSSAIDELHAEFGRRGGRFFVCRASVRLRGLTDGPWSDQTEISEAEDIWRFMGDGPHIFHC